MELCWFSQNYKATFVNKGLICEEMKPWRQRMVCFPLCYRNAVSCPSHEKNLLQQSRCRTAHLQKPRAAHAGSTGPRRKPHLRGQPWVSRSWSCYTCRTSPYRPLKKGDWPVLHLFFNLSRGIALSPPWCRETGAGGYFCSLDTASDQH